MNKYVVFLIFTIIFCLISIGCYSFPVAKGWSDPAVLIKSFDNRHNYKLLNDNVGAFHLFWMQTTDEKTNTLCYLKFNNIIDVGIPETVFSFTGSSSYDRFCVTLDNKNIPHCIIKNPKGFSYVTYIDNKWVSSVIPIPANAMLLYLYDEYYTLSIDEHNQRYFIWFNRDSPDCGSLYYTTSSNGITWTQPQRYQITHFALTHGRAIWEQNKFHLIWGDENNNNKCWYYAVLSAEGVLSKPKQLPDLFYYDKGGMGVDRNGNFHIVGSATEDGVNSCYYCSLVNGQWVTDKIPLQQFNYKPPVYWLRFNVFFDSDNRPHLLCAICKTVGLSDPNTSVYYTSFDGQKWQEPYLVIRDYNAGVVIDHNTIHVIWTDQSRDDSGKISLYYSSYAIK